MSASLVMLIVGADGLKWRAEKDLAGRGILRNHSRWLALVPAVGHEW